MQNEETKLARRMKFQAPSSKLQRSTKLQISDNHRAVCGAWCLEFLWSLDVGAWSFNALYIR
jgi:hypothetical protein